ncbi:MAG TPA: hypothetical protein VNQ90_01965 [Chthoniobacteraceae bacterium]|nr:hypothetical protein [Chthoniobacteraceae bacterium]
MKRYRALFGSFLLLAPTLGGAELKYPQEVALWQEVSIPLVLNRSEREVRFFAANRSRHQWRVFMAHGQVCARLTSGEPPQRDLPPFAPKPVRLAAYGAFANATSFARVADGWLIGYNQGEFGGALHWYSRDGRRHYKISDHQIVDFFRLPTGWHAVEGMEHRHTSQGSVIRLVQTPPNARWRAVTIVRLPSAPYAASVCRDGSMLVTLSNSLVQVEAWGGITTLFADTPWGRLYPGSSVLSSDEQKLYLGMRQFVGEFDLSTKKLRLLVPSSPFLNLPGERD